MKDTKTFSRRDVLKSATTLSLMATLSTSPGLTIAQGATSNARILVTYFSRTGHTRLIAQQIRQAYGADIFEIRPATPYPEDLDALVKEAAMESETGVRPALASVIDNVRSYDFIFLGFPIWGATVPGVIRSFLSSHDLSGKTIAPFITHGGYGTGRSMKVVAADSPQSIFLQPFTKQTESERETLSQVTNWLKDIEVGK